MSKILIVDDEGVHRRGTALTLSKMGHNIIEAKDETEAAAIINSESLDLVITDMLMPPKDGLPEDMESGLRIINMAKTLNPSAVVVVMTAHGSIENAVQAMRAGAFDYLTKPFSANELKVKAKKALEQQQLISENLRLSEENNYLKNSIYDPSESDKIVGQSESMKKLMENIYVAAQSQSTVLIRGESGTGKELVAKAIHYNSPRRDKVLVPLNCAAFPSELIEDELFGHRKGAFSGATGDRKGAFEEADGGTIFLDEIGEMPLKMQPRLLRVLEQKEVKRIGDNIAEKVDVRVLAATNKDLEDAVSKNKFRGDLFERLNVISIFVPPLRERKEDIPLLVEHFIQKFNKETSKRIEGVSKNAIKALMERNWPRNVRELKNVIERTVIFKEGKIIQEKDLCFSDPIPQNNESGTAMTASLPVGSSLEDMEKVLIEKTLNANDWNKTRTAEQLGIKHPKTLLDKIKKYDIKQPDS
ncbi:response regulator [Candidatus Poribacteria bacterium]|nr:response regulator [Candidatus Poribacteria bacterium]